MTILFGLKNRSYEDSIALSFANLKEKLQEQKEKEKWGVKFVKLPTKIQESILYGLKIKFAELAVRF